MSPLSPAAFNRTKDYAAALEAAAKPLRLLSSVDWDDTLRVRFLDRGTLPAPVYETIDVSDSLDAVKNIRKHLTGDHVIYAWLARVADDIESTANLIASRGTSDFYTHSQHLFGQPSQLMLDRSTKVIDFARHVDATMDGLDISKLMMSGADKDLDATQFAGELRPLLARHFGEDAPSVEVHENLSAKATASSHRIRVRAGAKFTERDIDQLLQHEALIHVATSLNGQRQEHFPILGRAHAGTTQVQEGLAVFAEMISGAMDPKRFRRLADRVIAIQNVIDGADFKEVYDFYMARLDDPDQAYENTRRIFRGGVISGRAPFTKDMVYLNGLLRVHNFMRSAVKLGRADLIRVLFCGKMDIEDVPALAQLASRGQLTAPKYLPPWVKDLRFLVSYMAYSGFLNQVKLPGFQAYYEDAMADVPVVWDLVD